MTAAIKSPSNAVLSGSASFSQLSEKTIGFEAKGTNRQALGTFAVGLVYSTFLGGGGDDYGWGIAVDGNGNAYVTGFTASSDFPTLNPYQATYQGGDAFVTKLSGSGSSLIYSTYLGGADGDVAYAIAVDGGGNAYVTGYTFSSNFPTLNPYQGTFQGGYGDAFVTKLSSSGASLIYSTYLGGAEGDGGSDIAVDGSGNAYVTGGTFSSNFPTFNPYQMYQGRGDVFVTKLSTTGNNLLYSTYLGADSTEGPTGIAVDGSGNAYVTGYTYSTNFPTHNPYQTMSQGYGDVFVTKLSSSGSSLIYSTCVGGESMDYGIGIAVDDSGYAYVTGVTWSTNFPTLNPYQGMFQGGMGDVFVTKLSGPGSSLIYSTYLGGGGEDYGYGIAVDGSGNAYVTGLTYSSNFPTLNPYQTFQGSPWSDAFVTKLSSSGVSLIYSTDLGGKRWDEGLDIAVDGSGNAYVTGRTSSSNFPTLNPYRGTYRDGGYDVFVAKLSELEYTGGDANTDAAVDISDAVYLISYIFSGGPAPNPLLSGDANCDSTVDISDVVYLISYIFSGGAAPCEGCK
jgi:hypothetical protein